KPGVPPKFSGFGSCPARAARPRRAGVPTQNPVAGASAGTSQGPADPPAPWLGLVAGGPLLQSPQVAVRIAEIGVEDPAHVVDVAQPDAARRQSGAGRSHVRHDQMDALDRTG